jgi:hypothetical protein
MSFVFKTSTTCNEVFFRNHNVKFSACFSEAKFQINLYFNYGNTYIRLKGNFIETFILSRSLRAPKDHLYIYGCNGR